MGETTRRVGEAGGAIGAVFAPLPGGGSLPKSAGPMGMLILTRGTPVFKNRRPAGS